MSNKSARICELNDNFRKTFTGGRVMITDGVAALPPEMQQAVFAAVKTFEAFDCPNDPYGEHDFGSVAISGTAVFWKIDAYDREMQFGSEDPSDPAQTTRVLTIMLAQEY